MDLSRDKSIFLLVYVVHQLVALEMELQCKLFHDGLVGMVKPTVKN